MKNVDAKFSVTVLLLLLSCCYISAQELSVKSDSLSIKASDTTSVQDRETKNRNVMLSAESATSPRQLNIGLPFAGDILILENDLPVVYSFWTQMPLTTWRYDNSIGRIGLMSFAEGALTFGKVGYMVTSSDREPGSKFKGYATTFANNFGSLRYDAAFTGPIGKKGWGYMLGFNETYDRGSGVDYKFTPYQDRAEFFKAGISKKYDRGNLRFYYKYASSKTIYGAYNPILYEGDGKTSSIEGYDLGRSAYLPVNGLFPYYDTNSGEAKWADLNSDETSKTFSHTFYLTGEHRFKNGMKLSYSSMYMRSQVAFTIQYPISLMVQDPDQRSPGELYTFHGTDNAYDGPVQLVSAQYYPKAGYNTFQSRAELTKKQGNHNLRLGATYQYYRAPQTYNGGLYYQTVEANPKLLDRYQDLSVYGGSGVVLATPNGLLPSNGIGGYSLVSTKKIGLYVSDDAKINKWLNAGVGFRIERQNDHQISSPYINQFIRNRPLLDLRFNNKWNYVATANLVAKLTNNFGLLGDVTYNDWHGRYADYPQDQKDPNGNPVAGAVQTEIHDMRQNVLNFGGGIYLNHGSLFSIVSKVTRISKNRNIASESIVNPANTTQVATFNPIFYDISTIGWTTDIISQPFENFHVHYLLTLQKPRYKNYSYSAFDITYDYENRAIPELSDILMELDPSYFMMKGDLKLWVSLRYFGKQNGNKTNSIYYRGWWESFGGVNYKMTKNVELGLQLVNILDQKGIKGGLVQADQILDASPYVGRKIVAGAIRPRTLELTANFKF